MFLEANECQMYEFESQYSHILLEQYILSANSTVLTHDRFFSRVRDYMLNWKINSCPLVIHPK
jgi:hypothetical protein